MRQQFDAIVTEVVWREPSTGFTAFRVKSGQSVFMCVADVARIEVGKSLTLAGEFTDNHQFGHVFDCLAVESEVDRLLLEHGISAAPLRAKILDAHDADELDLFSMEIPYAVADDLSKALGKGEDKRVLAATRMLLSAPRAARGLPESVLAGAIAKACRMDLIEAQASLRALIAGGAISITSGGQIVTADSFAQSDEIAAALLKFLERRSIMTDVQWSSVVEEGILPSYLTPAEATAVRMAMLNPIVIISARNPDFLERLEEASSILETFHPNPEHKLRVVDYFTDHPVEDLLDALRWGGCLAIVGDPLSETTWAPYVRAMIAPRLITTIEVMPTIETPLDEALERLAKTKKMPATAVAKDGTVRHLRPDKSEAITVYEEPDPLAAVAWLVDELRADGPVESLAICATEGGINGRAEFGDALRATSVSGAPVAGTFFLGDRILHPQRGLCIVTGPKTLEPLAGGEDFNSDPSEWRPAWAISIETARVLGHQVQKVYVVLGENHRWSWLECYHAVRLARTAVTIVGSRNAIRKLARERAQPQGRVEALVDRLTEIRKRRTEEVE